MTKPRFEEERKKQMIASIEVYSNGIVSCSACVPKDMTKEQIETAVNEKSPTGISSKWIISEDKTFSDQKTPHPCICDQDPERMHYLLHC